MCDEEQANGPVRVFSLSRLFELLVIKRGNHRLARAGRRNHQVSRSPAIGAIRRKLVQDLLLIRVRMEIELKGRSHVGSTAAFLLDGDTFQLLQRAQRFLRDHLPVAGRIVPDLFERLDDPLYPPAALREALANALCHRDYSIGGGAVSIAIYDDRLEISSTGVLPFDLTPDDLTRPHPSRPWNPLIAQVLYRRGIIEAWGRGTIKMAELTEQAGLVSPEFECSGGEVVVRFRPTRYVPPTRVGHDLGPLQRELLEVLARTGPASLKQVMGNLLSDTPERTVQDNLQMLRRLGLVDAAGKGRGARWMLKGIRP